MSTLEADQTSPGVPARQVILSAAALWLCYFVLITVRGLVVELGEFNELLWRRALVTLVGIAVTVLAWPLLRRFDGRGLGVRIAAALVIMFPAAMVLAFANQLAFAPVEQRMLQKITTQQVIPAPVPSTATGEAKQAAEQARHTAAGAQAAAAVHIRHDMAGNVLVDVLDDIPTPGPSARPAPKAPPAPPAPPVPPGFVRNPDGSTEFRRPGVLVKRWPDGSSEVRSNGMVIRTGPNDEIQTVEPGDNDADADDASDPDTEAYIDRKTADALARAFPQPPAPPAPEGGPAPAPAPRPKAKSAPAKVKVRVVEKPKRVAAAPTPAAAAPAPQPAASSAPITTPPPPPPAQTTIEVIKQKVDDEGLWRQLTDVALGRYFLLIAWAALYLALGNAAQMQAAERREGEYKRAAKAAELRSLRYQVNPHFLFNTLNSLSALVMSGRSEKAEEMIQTMSSFYRHSLAGDPTADVQLADEIALQRHYLEIEGVRFPERLRAEFDVPEELEDACVPGMILQPLVENSVKYAVAATGSPITIRISAREAGEKLVLTVSDDGPGKPDGAGGTGIGLANVRDRLAARFGAEASVESAALPAGGYSTTLIIPVVRNDC